MSIQEQLDQGANERVTSRAVHRRAQIVNGLLYGFSFLCLVLFVAISSSLYTDLQHQREARGLENAQSDLITCSRANYQDARDKLQDQLILDLVVVKGLKEGEPTKERTAVFEAANEQLGFRLKTQPPAGAVLLERWRGNPVSESVRRQRAVDAAGPVARAQARDRGDFVKLPVNCDRLPSQRPFTR